MHRLGWQRAQCDDLAPRRRKIVSRRQRAAPQQAPSSPEAPAARQLPERVAADDQLAGLAVDVTEAGLSRDDTVQAARFAVHAHGDGRRRAARGGEGRQKRDCRRRRAARGGEGRQKHDGREELMTNRAANWLFTCMAPHKRFVAWQECHKLVLAVYRSTELFPKHELYGLTSQLRRAAFSAAANLVEGASRKGRNEFRHF